MPRLKNPCKRECPKRSSTCHGTCKEYKDFVADNAAERESIRKQKEKEDNWTAGGSHRYYHKIVY